MVTATEQEIWHCVSQVSDPEIPVISIVDLGIVREVMARADGSCEIVITPTYSGCPAMQVIADGIRETLHARGISSVSVHTQLSPAWTTDWISEAGRAKLRSYGIAPPVRGAAARATGGTVVDITALLREQDDEVVCPQCGSANTRLISQFGSTACKALYRCNDCLEPFDYFKPH